MKYQKITTNDPVGNFCKLSIQNNRKMCNFLAAVLVDHRFGIVWIKSKALLRPGWIGLDWGSLPFRKLQVYNTVQLYNIPNIRCRYKIF